MADDPKNVFPIKADNKILQFLKKLSFIPILIIILVISVPSMIYSVEPDEEAVVLRLGEFNRTRDPGLHFKMPWGIEDVIKVPVRKILKLEFGFRTKRPGIRTQYEPNSKFKKII